MDNDLLDLRTIILKMLSKSPKHGYELVKEIEENLDWKPSLGGIYPVLKELEKKGLILGHEMVEYGRFKKVYSLTSKGKEELQKIENNFWKFKRFMEY